MSIFKKWRDVETTLTPATPFILASDYIQYTLGSVSQIEGVMYVLESAGIQEVILNFQDVLQVNALRFFAQEFIA